MFMNIVLLLFSLLATLLLFGISCRSRLTIVSPLESREITWRCYPKSECTHLETSRDEWEREWVSQRGRARRRKTENKCLAFVSCIFRYHKHRKNWKLSITIFPEVVLAMPSTPSYHEYRNTAWVKIMNGFKSSRKKWKMNRKIPNRHDQRKRWICFEMRPFHFEINFRLKLQPHLSFRPFDPTTHTIPHIYSNSFAEFNCFGFPLQLLKW